MWATLLLVGFMPWETAPPAPVLVPTGAPAPHLARDRGLSTRLSQSARWTQFTSTWGPGWAARWDPHTHLPRFLYAPGVPHAQASDLVADIARLVGIDPSELVAAKPVVGEDRTWLRWTRTWQGAEVEGDTLLLAVQDGRIGGVWVRITPIVGLPMPRAGEVIRPLPTPKWDAHGRPTGTVPHLVTRTDTADEVVYHDRSGQEVHRFSTRHYDAAHVSHLLRTVGDAHVESPARQLFVTDTAGTSDTTADDGSHGHSGTVSIALDGPALEVRTDGNTVPPVWLTPDSAGTSVLRGGTDISEASASVLHHTHVVFDWLDLRWPTHGWLGQKVPANVDITSSACNAYYTSGTINFFVGYGSSCHNLGQVADVIYHEVGHGIHHFILAGGTFAGDVSEGSADYVSATINHDPIIGLNARPGGGIVRDLDPDRIYPDDAVGEVHTDGLIWGSFLWNLRELWQATYGTEAGIERTDLLFLATLQQGPTLTDLYEAVILADDDDGDLSNGTPHACTLKDLLDHHGLGPGPMGVVVLEHTPLGPQSSSAEGYPVDFRVFSPTADCADFDPSSVSLWYTTGPLDSIPGIDPDGPDDPWAGWTELPLVADADTETQYSGTVPRQVATTQVHYFMRAASTDGSEVLWSHGGVREGVHAFRVGDRTALWCEDFEAGLPPEWTHGGGLPETPRPELLDQWEAAPASGGSFVPDSAESGTHVAGTHVAGLYAPNNQQFLTSAPIEVPDGRMTLLTYSRWLTVEDGIYDRATASADGVPYFENSATDGGLGHTLDMGWTQVELEIDPLRATTAADGELVLDWTLSSDPGLEFGGWHIDDVCVVQLADIPAHYRRTGLTASLDDTDRVTLHWENPWIEPLDRVKLVSVSGATLTDLSTADVLLEVDGATAGAAGTYLDGLPLEPGASRTYALVAAPSADEPYFDDLSDGDNRVTVSADPLPVDSGLPHDSADPDPSAPDADTGHGVPTLAPTPKDAGCGCTSAAHPIRQLAWLLAWVPLVGRVRRRSPTQIPSR